MRHQFKENLKQQTHFQPKMQGFKTQLLNFEQPRLDQLQKNSTQQQLIYTQTQITPTMNQSIIKKFILEPSQSERSQVSSIIQRDSQGEGPQIFRLPSIEYIVQDEQRKTRSIALMMCKLRKWSDFCQNKPSYSSREVISQKTLDTGNYELKQYFRDQNYRNRHIQVMKNPIFLYQPCPEQFSMLRQPIKQDVLLHGQIINHRNQNQLSQVENQMKTEGIRIRMLKYKNRQLQQLYAILMHSNSSKSAVSAFKKQHSLYLKEIIERMKILK